MLGLDAVRTLVGQVAGDQRVLAPVREAFVAMEPALLRMAMHDPRFFGDDHHPARRLIEGVAQRSFKYNDEYSEDFERFMAPVREAVRGLNAMPEAKSEDFAHRLAGLETEWQALDAGDREVQQESLRSMHFAQERQALADKVAWEFSLRSDLERVPHIVADFLFNDWSLVIAHAQLTDKRGQLDPGGYLAVVSNLLWSVNREAALKAPARVFEVIPGVVSTLRRGLQMLGKEPEETQTFFDALMRYHDPVLRLRRVRSARDAEASGFARLDSESSLVSFETGGMPIESEQIPLERPKPRAAEQPWFGRNELAAAGFEDIDSAPAPLETAFSDPGLPSGHDEDAGFASTEPVESDAAASGVDGGDGLAEEERSGSPKVEPAGRPAHGSAAFPESQSEEEIKAWTRATLERMRTGDWFDLRVRGQWRRAQLSWTSDNRALFMFVSRGGRPHSMTRRTCEKLILNRNLRPLDGAAVVDKALRGLADGPMPVRGDLEVAST